MRMGNDGNYKIVRIGNIYLNSSIRFEFILKIVRHIPNVCLNPISIGKLDNEGYANYFFYQTTQGRLFY
jgi:hypothetical protein